MIKRVEEDVRESAPAVGSGGYDGEQPRRETAQQQPERDA